MRRGVRRVRVFRFGSIGRGALLVAVAAVVVAVLGGLSLAAPTPPSISINDVTVAEGNSGTTPATFTVTLSSPATSPVTFDIATQDGTATAANNDYTPQSPTGQTIATGQQTFSYTVDVIGDTTVENNETFNVKITNISGATAADDTG